MFATLIATAAQPGAPWHDGYTGPPPFWPIFPILWLLIIVTVAVIGFTTVRRNRAAAPRRSGEARLAEQFAAGEIDVETYRTRRGVLREK